MGTFSDREINGSQTTIDEAINYTRTTRLFMYYDGVSFIKVGGYGSPFINGKEHYFVFPFGGKYWTYDCDTKEVSEAVKTTARDYFRKVGLFTFQWFDDGEFPLDSRLKGTWTGNVTFKEECDIASGDYDYEGEGGGYWGFTKLSSDEVIYVR